MRMRHTHTAHKACSVVLGLVVCIVSVQGAPYQYDPWSCNKVCKYQAFNVSKEVFYNGSESATYFPLETTQAVTLYDKPSRACFGPGESIDLSAIQAQRKLPCVYKVNQWGYIDYWEYHACDSLLKANCYCYSINKFVGSYCEPGLGGTGKSFQLPVVNCSSSIKGVIADGGKPVSRDALKKMPKGHYIALAVKPADVNDATGGQSVSSHALCHVLRLLVSCSCLCC